MYFKSILTRQNFFLIDNLAQNVKDENLFISSSSLYFLVLHLRLSSLFYLTQLVDIFSYETTLNLNTNTLGVGDFFTPSKSLTSVIVYNFHAILTQHRFFVFCINFSMSTKSTKLNPSSGLFSISELFFSANWLEREVAELNGIIFGGKKDLRNLMLQYGDSTVPFQKSFPTVGLREMFYNPVKDTIIQSPVSFQI